MEKGLRREKDRSFGAGAPWESGWRAIAAGAAPGWERHGGVLPPSRDRGGPAARLAASRSGFLLREGERLRSALRPGVIPRGLKDVSYF